MLPPSLTSCSALLTGVVVCVRLASTGERRSQCGGGRMARMQSDDPAYPAYLEVGTEVSAKYRGAFCEAKVRKVVKQVKAKVSMALGRVIGSF